MSFNLGGYLVAVGMTLPFVYNSIYLSLKLSLNEWKTF